MTNQTKNKDSQKETNMDNNTQKNILAVTESVSPAKTVQAVPNPGFLEKIQPATEFVSLEKVVQDPVKNHIQKQQVIKTPPIEIDDELQLLLTKSRMIPIEVALDPTINETRNLKVCSYCLTNMQRVCCFESSESISIGCIQTMIDLIGKNRKWKLSQVLKALKELQSKKQKIKLQQQQEEEKIIKIKKQIQKQTIANITTIEDNSNGEKIEINDVGNGSRKTTNGTNIDLKILQRINLQKQIQALSEFIENLPANHKVNAVNHINIEQEKTIEDEIGDLWEGFPDNKKNGLKMNQKIKKSVQTARAKRAKKRLEKRSPSIIEVSEENKRFFSLFLHDIEKRNKNRLKMSTSIKNRDV